jgi:hypothetical protein
MADGNLTDAIKTNAQAPASASGDGVSAQQHRLTEQIAADQHVAANAAVARNTRTLGIRFAKIVSPGAV